MSSLWKRRVKSAWSAVSGDDSRVNENQPVSRDTIIRDALLAELAEVCGELGYMINDAGAPPTSSRITDATPAAPPDELAETEAQLCQCIEAVFLHGLNDSFLWQTAIAIGHSTPGDRRPAPNFWPPLLVFTHRETIQQIHQLNQLHTDIGRCRAWIRTALNDGLLAAYVDTMRLDTKALQPYYRRGAFVRDGDRMAVAQRLLADLESRAAKAVHGGWLQLTVNSSLLDRWPDRPLQLAGLYAPAVREYPVSAGFDIASSLKDDEDVEEAEEGIDQQQQPTQTSAIPMPKRLPIDQAFDISIRNSPFYEPLLHHTFANEKTDDAQDLADLLDRMDAAKGASTEEEEHSDQIPNDGDSLNESKSMGNSLVSSTIGWSLDDGQGPAVADAEDQDTVVSSTFSTLVARHRKQTDANRAINPAEVWQRFESSLIGGEDEVKTDENVNTPIDGECDDSEMLDFEVITEDVTTLGENAHFSLADLRLLVAQSSRLPLEMGIDAQDFRCAGCPTPLVVGSTTAGQLCHFSGAYYCTSCLDAKPHAIPARIIFNWDFGRRQVSRRAALFLREFEHQPFIDLRLLNPDIYSAVDEMAHMQSLRIQLNFVRAYLATCQDAMSDGVGAFGRMRRQLWPRNYLYDTVHRYSLADLLTLAQLGDALKQAISDGSGHVRSCLERCSPKGHICELCDRLESVLFPFDVETTVRCDSCAAVFHAECFEKQHRENEGVRQIPCPRCERRKLRADASE